MVRIKVCSGLAGLALASGLVAQEPVVRVGVAEPVASAVVDGADAAVVAALANHPDVKLAEAKVRVAEAELAQAKLLVAQRVSAASARVAQAKAKVATATSGFNRLKKLHQQKAVSNEEVAGSEQSLLAAKAELAAAEAELKAAQGVPPGVATVRSERSNDWAISEADRRRLVFGDAIVRGLSTTVQAASPAGSPADKLRGQLDKEVTLNQPKLPFDEALAAFQNAAGLTGLTIRFPEWASAKVLKAVPTVGPLAGTRTVAGWLQLLLDDFNLTHRDVGRAREGSDSRYDIFIRDYGLLMTRTDLAPAGALTLTQFTHLPRLTGANGGKLSHPVGVKVAELLAKTVKLQEQKKPLRDLVTEVVKAAGSDLEITSALYTDPGLTLQAGERTVAAWLALMLDLRNGNNSQNERVVIYVREYGLLLGQTNNPPAGAVPLGEFLDGKQ